jgi:hypothetical protein
VGSKKQTILTLNGHRYDALTGKLLEAGSSPTDNHVISDVVAPKSNHGQVAPPVPSPTENPKPIAATPTGPRVMDVSRNTSHISRRHQQKAHTLVRSAVSKPKPGWKSQTIVSAPTTDLSVPELAISPKLSYGQVDLRRQKLATHVAKSEAISKFTDGTVVGSVEPSPQQLAAVSTRAPVEAIEHQTSASQELFDKAIAAAETRSLHDSDPKQLSKQARKQTKAATKAKRPVHHHLASVVAASVAVLAIGSIIGLHNKNSLTLRFADAKAGFSAKLPTYQPEGYGVGSFNYTPGSVGTSFHSDTGDREYTLNQQTTAWDSQALLDNYVAVNYPSYHALQSGDQIVYVYGKNDASWIKNGVWYQLRSDGNLSTSQVLSIAASI